MNCWKNLKYRLKRNIFLILLISLQEAPMEPGSVTLENGYKLDAPPEQK